MAANLPTWAAIEYSRGRRMRELADARNATYARLIGAWYDGDAELVAALGDAADQPMPMPEREAVCMLGFSGMPAEWVSGWRYGFIPAEGRSFNHRDQRWERGISLMALDGDEGRTLEMSLTEALNGDRPVVRVRGLRTPWCGSDGEPLVLLATEV